MKIDISDLKKGSFIKLDVINPRCDTYGAMQIMGVRVISEKFCTRWEDFGGYHSPSTDADYIDRQTIIIKLKNEHGKVVEQRYWLDELTDPKSDFPNLVLLSGTDWKSAHDEVQKLVSKEWLNRAYRELRHTATGVYADIFKHSNIDGSEKALRIKELVGELVELL